MPEMISHSFEKSAFLGEKARDQKFSDKINDTSKKINVILNPIDSAAAKQANGKAAKMVEGLKENNEWGCDNVRSLIEASQDTQRPQNQEVAKKRLEVLAYSTYIAMKHGGNADLETAVGAVDGGAVDAKLPDSLNGLGGLVVDIAVNQEISNPQLKDALKKLDRQANVLRSSGAMGEEKLKELIGNKILDLSELVDELDDRGYEELTRVSAYLGAEADKIGEKVEVKHENVGMAHEKPAQEKTRESVEDIINKKLEKHPLAFDKSEMPSDDDTDEEKEEKLRMREIKIEKRGKGVSEVLNLFDRRNRGERSELEIMGPVSIDEIRHTLKEMENSGRDVSDLTLNSRKFGRLIDITNDINDKIGAMDEGDAEKIKTSIVVFGKDGHVMNKAEMVELRNEIKMRSFLNDFYLATSDAHDIESMAKTIIAFHKGDTDKDWDKTFLSFFLKEGKKKNEAGDVEKLGSANGLFVDVAWDLRQSAYFNYGGENKDMERVFGSEGEVERGLLNNISEKKELMSEYGKLKGIDESKAKEEFLGVSLLMGKNLNYKIDKNYFTNLRNDLDLARKEIVKKYMIEQIVKEVEGKNPNLKGKYTNDEAERAYELARKLSVATYTDSAANIAFADGDDYAELILFKFLRYQDGVEVAIDFDKAGNLHKKPAKNKPVGSIESIKYVETLTPPWLATFAKKESDRGMWRVLKAENIDLDKINPKSESTYHFGSIILKKVQQAKTILMSGAGAKDLMDPDKTQQVYERLSKTVAEADKAGWNVFNPEYFQLPRVDGVRIKERSVEDLAQAQRYMRFVYVLGLMERATKTSLYGWTRTAYDDYVKLLMKSGMFTDTDGNQSETFISNNQLDWINKAYRPRQIFNIFESQERSRKRKIFR